MNCQSCRMEIEELEEGLSLSRDACAHLTACQPCRTFRDERLALRRLVGSLEPVSAPPDFEFRLRARLAAAGNGRSRGFSFRSLISSAPAIGLAASFALLVAAVVVYNQLKPSHDLTDRAAVITEKSGLNHLGLVNLGPAPAASPVIAKGEDKEQKILVANNGSRPASPTAPIKGAISRQPRRVGPTAGQLQSSEMAVNPAPRITQGGVSPFVAVSNQSAGLHVRSSSQPVRVRLDERGGAKRTVTLEPVVFGSQDFIGRNNSGTAAPQGIW